MVHRVAHERGCPMQGKPLARRPVARNGRQTQWAVEDGPGHGGRSICGGARIVWLRVNVCMVQSKPKRRGLYRGRRPGWKKAIVQLRPGDSIEIFEGVHA